MHEIKTNQINDEKKILEWVILERTISYEKDQAKGRKIDEYYPPPWVLFK